MAFYMSFIGGSAKFSIVSTRRLLCEACLTAEENWRGESTTLTGKSRGSLLGRIDPNDHINFFIKCAYSWYYSHNIMDMNCIVIHQVIHLVTDTIFHCLFHHGWNKQTWQWNFDVFYIAFNILDSKLYYRDFSFAPVDIKCWKFLFLDSPWGGLEYLVKMLAR